MRSRDLAFRKHLAFTLAAAAVAAISSQAGAAGPPQQLIGKSIVLSWSNTREQRDQKPDGSWTNFHTVQGGHKLILYVSTTGRVFSRRINTTKSGSGNMDQVGSEASGAYPVSTPSFSGQTMSIVSVAEGGAGRTEINFDSGFTSCTARVSYGFEAGKTSVMLSPITKRKVETRSVQNGAVNCSVQSGNALEGAG